MFDIEFLLLWCHTNYVCWAPPLGTWKQKNFSIPIKFKTWKNTFLYCILEHNNVQSQLKALLFAFLCKGPLSLSFSEKHLKSFSACRTPFRMWKKSFRKNELEYIHQRIMWHRVLMQRKFSNQSTDITLLMCYVMTAEISVKLISRKNLWSSENFRSLVIYRAFFWRPVDCPPAFKRTSCCHSSNTFLCKRNSFEMP